MTKKELLEEMAERMRIESLPQNIGWIRKYERNTHLNNSIERERASGHRIKPAPRLDQLDGECDPMERGCP